MITFPIVQTRSSPQPPSKSSSNCCILSLVQMPFTSPRLMRLLLFLFLLLVRFETNNTAVAAAAATTTGANSAVALSNNNTQNINNEDTSPSNNETEDSVLALTNSTTEDQQEEDDPFANDPFGGGSPADSEPNPWEAYPWDVTHTISHVSGALSVIGSGWIVVEVLRDKKKLRLSYHRIMLGLSAYDLASSFWLFIGVWVTSNQRGFSGQSVSGWCETSGFFIYLGSLCIPMYNTALAIYFWVTIKYGWRESRIKQSYERYIHWTIAGCGIVPAIVAIPLNLYNPWYSYCFVTSAIVNGEKRGTDEMAIIFLAMSWTFVFGSAAIVSLTMISIYVNVHAIQKRVQRYNFGGNIINNKNNNNNDEGSNKNNDNGQVDLSDTTVPLQNESNVAGNTKDNTGRPRLERKSSSRSSLGSILSEAAKKSGEYMKQKLSRARRRSQMHNNNRKARTRQVRTMGLLYTIPFFATWVVPSIFFAMTRVAWHTGRAAWINPRNTFIINTYIATILPIQGFFNWIIYMRPRFQRLRREHPSWGIQKLLMGVLGRMFTPRQNEFQEGPGADASKRSTRSAKGNDLENRDGIFVNKNYGYGDAMENVSISSSEEDDDFSDDESMMASLRYVKKDSQEDSFRVRKQYTGDIQITNNSQMPSSSESSSFEDSSLRYLEQEGEEINRSQDENKSEACPSTTLFGARNSAESDIVTTSNCHDYGSPPPQHINTVDVQVEEANEVDRSLKNVLATDVEEDVHENSVYYGNSTRSDITIDA